jgi:hypothetical protein
MIVRPGPGLEFPQLHPLGWPMSPIEGALVAAVVPLYRRGEVAVLSYAEALQLLKVEREAAVITEALTRYVGAIAVGDITPVHPTTAGPVCAYLQSRRLLRVDCDAHTHRESRLLRSEENAQYGMWADAEMRRIAVQVEDTSQYDDGEKVIHRVDVFDVSGEVRRIGGRELDRPEERGEGWAAGGGLVAVARAGGLEVFDAELQPLPRHPLADGARRALSESGADRVHALRIHPTRPVAALSVRTGEAGGMRSYATWWISWSNGAAEVRSLAEFSAIDGLALGAFAPQGEAIDVRAATCGATRLVIVEVAAGLLHDLGIVRKLQGACWSTEPPRYLAFDRTTGEILVWPGGAR